jgi:hypothetical protein
MDTAQSLEELLQSGLILDPEYQTRLQALKPPTPKKEDQVCEKNVVFSLIECEKHAPL